MGKRGGAFGINFNDMRIEDKMLVEEENRTMAEDLQRIVPGLVKDEGYQNILDSIKKYPEETESVQNTFSHYQGNGYEEINNFLRMGEEDFRDEYGYGESKEYMDNKISKIQQYIADMDGFIGTTKMTEDAICFRCTSPKFFNTRPVGKSWTDKGFLSSTVNRTEAKELLPVLKQSTGYIVRLLVPKGINAIMPDIYRHYNNAKYNPDSMHTREGEIIVGRGYRYRTVSLDKERKIATVEVLKK